MSQVEAHVGILNLARASKPLRVYFGTGIKVFFIGHEICPTENLLLLMTNDNVQ